MYKICVFDLDGTLVDSHKDLAASGNFALSKRGLPTHLSEKYKEFIGNGVKLLVSRALGEKGTDEALVSEVLEDFNAYYADHLTDYTTIYDGMGELINMLRMRGILCAIFTNKPDDHSKNVAAKLFPAGSFTFVVGNSEGYPKKPDPTALNVMLSALNLQKEDCLYIGDSHVDVATARAAGVKVVGVTWGFSKDEMLKACPDFAVSDANLIYDIATL